MKGTFSDLNNAGKSPYGGASTAAAFLEYFINKETKWAHLDICGPGYDNKGATGFGTQLVLDYLCRESKSQ